MKDIRIALLQVGDSIWLRGDHSSNQGLYFRHFILTIKDEYIACQQSIYLYVYKVNKTEIFIGDNCQLYANSYNKL